MAYLQRIACVALVCLGAGACATREAPGEVYADYDPGTSFRSYHSYSWMSPNPLFVNTGQPVNPGLESRLMSETAAVLKTRGFTRVEKREDADFVVAFSVGARDSLQENNFTGGDRMGDRMGRVGNNIPAASEVREVTTGAIAIEIFHRESGQRTWTGWATAAMTMDVRADSDPLVRDVVHRILEQFPPSS